MRDVRPELTVVTAVDPARVEYLDRAAASVASLLDVVSVQWIVAWDGKPSHQLSSAPVQLQGRAGAGISATRNLALPEIRAPFVTVLDADDELTTDGVLVGLEFLKDSPSTGWLGLSRTLTNDERTPHTLSRPQSYQPGELSENWTAPFPFHPNSIILRADLLRLVGGWPAITSNEDLGMLLQASERMGGCTTQDVLTKYRVWPGQEVAKLDYKRMKEKSFRYIEVVVNQIRQSMGRAPIRAPQNPGGAFGTTRSGQ